MERFALNLQMERVWRHFRLRRWLLQQCAAALHTGQLATQCFQAEIGIQSTPPALVPTDDGVGGTRQVAISADCAGH